MAPPLLLLFLLLFSLSPASPDLLSDRAALLALRDAVGRTAVRWNDTNSPCSWQGVICEAGAVTALRLPGVGLMGSLPDNVLGNLTSLRTLSLRFNALTGSVPADLARCVQLRNLYLQHNRLSGEIPPALSSLTNLVRLNLADNQFSGEIPAGLGNLSRLGTLYLENNQLAGQLPDVDLPNLVQFNVSFNQLNGSVPVKLRSMPREAFLGMQLCGGALGPCPGEAAPPAPGPGTPVSNGGGTGGESGGRNKKKLSGGAIAGIAIGSVIGFLLLVGLLFILCRKGGRSRTRALEAGTVKPPESELPIREKGPGDLTNGNGAPAMSMVAAAAAVGAAGSRGEAASAGSKKLVFFGRMDGRVFDLEDLLRASAEVLGKGTFGTAYKAVLEMGIVVAVKRLKDVNLPEKEFKDQIEIVGAMEHPNLVPLRAYYFSKDEKLLVYDYMSMGSLSALLHGNRGSGRTPLNWEARCSIALSAARGIEYIHSRGPAISHGNIKSSNILLAKSNEARVSDHGLAHLVSPSSFPNRVAGYRAPEVTDARRVSQKADVYSFGVLLLELLTGKAPAQALLNDEGVDLPRWVQSVVKEEWTSEVFDLELLRHQDVEGEMVDLLQLAIDCAAQYPDNRPSMSVVVTKIEEIRLSSLATGADEQQHPVAEDAAP